MIDWRKVDFEHIEKLINKDKIIEASTYLEQFLSSTYLSEIIASSEENK